MKSSRQIGDLIETMVDAWADGRQAELVSLLDDLLRGPRGDVMNVALVLAGILAEDLREVRPTLGFHSIKVTRIDADGQTSEGSALDLPGHVATFAQMVTAVANDDKPLARDLFLGFCGEDGQRALQLLIFGLNEVIHANTQCAECGDGDLDEVAP